MRQTIPALLLALSINSHSLSTAVANDKQDQVSIAQSQAAITQLNEELASTNASIEQKRAELRRYQSTASQLEKQSTELDNKRKATKANLDRSYSRMLEEPNIDLSKPQQQYQDVWNKIKQNQQERLNNQHQQQQLVADISLLKAQKNQKIAKLDTLQEDIIRTRVETLRTELNQTDSINVSFTNTCSVDMTLANCQQQTETLALQKAVNQFQAQIIDSAIKQDHTQLPMEKIGLNIHVVGKNVSQTKFFDTNKHQMIADVTLESRPAANTPCKLLSVSSSYCFPRGNVQQTQTQEVQWVTLTIRSNQYNDKVIVNDISYGDTPVDIMLPVGTHRIHVEKEGYKTFYKNLKIERDHTLRADLRVPQNLPTPGIPFSDKLLNSTAPTMMVIKHGNYPTGEHGTTMTRIKSDYAISQAPVTVAQFSQFVKKTNYKTDSELKKQCLAIKNSSIEPIANRHWREPNFRQKGNHPVVCVSKDDAKAYTQWLSKQTGYRYRLPTEKEWEVAARAGTKTHYWWGNDLDHSRANTGWGGTPWSNKSTSPVMSFTANSNGLYDTVGNVWEWVDSSVDIAKGGAWSFAPRKAAAHERLYIDSNSGANFLGFRLVREI